MIADLPTILDEWVTTQREFAQAVYPHELWQYSEQNTIVVITNITQLYASIDTSYQSNYAPDEE